MRVPMEKVPIVDRRRAARMLESLLSQSSPRKREHDLSEARFGEEVTPIYRPDLDDVAYWEFEIEGVRTALPIMDSEAKEFDRGFLVLSTGGHDVPRPHFSVELAPPSRQLEQFGTPERIVKLDSLCYVSEDARGTMLGHIGTMPPKLDGVPGSLPKRLPAGWARVAATETDKEDGDETPKVRLSRSRESRPFKGYGSWRSWEECKKGYAESYALHLSALAERARTPWEIEELTDKFGEGVREGETLSIPLLSRGDFTIDGPGAEFVSTELNPQPLPPRLLLTPKGGREARDLSFTVTFHYRGETESLVFFVVPEDGTTTVVPSDSPLGPTFGGE